MLEKVFALLWQFLWSFYRHPMEDAAGASLGKSWIVIHHWYGEPKTREEAHRLCLAEGYSDFPYNYIITREGAVWKGRPDTECAANLGINRAAIAICFLGNFQVQEPTPAQLYAARDIIRELLKSHPRAKLILHRDVNKIVPFALYRGRMVSTATACPGELFVRGRFGAILWAMVNGISLEAAKEKIFGKKGN